MRKLLIFGDSYSAEQGQRHPEADQLVPWHLQLYQAQLFDSIENYSHPGSSLYYQWLKFQQHYTGQETVLWFITAQGRHYHPEHGHVSNCQEIDHRLANWHLDRTRRQYLEALRAYTIHCANLEEQALYHQLLVDRIRTQAKDLYLVACFANSFDSECNLYEVCSMEQRAWGFDTYFDMIKQYTDIRRNHLTEANALRLGKIITESIRHARPITFTLADFEVPSTSDRLRYFRPV